MSEDQVKGFAFKFIVLNVLFLIPIYMPIWFGNTSLQHIYKYDPESMYYGTVIIASAALSLLCIDIKKYRAALVLALIPEITIVTIIIAVLIYRSISYLI